MIIRYICLAIIDAFALWFVHQTSVDGVWFLASAVAIITLGINLIFLKRDLYPLQWLSPGLALMLLMVIYPLVYTIYTAFTNYSDTHLLTKQQAIKIIENHSFLPEGTSTFRWTAFQSHSGEFALWLISEEGEYYFVRQGTPYEIVLPDSNGIGELDDQGIPLSIEGFERLDRIEAVQHINELSDLEFGQAPYVISIRTLDKAASYQQKFVYDSTQDAIYDRETDETYIPVRGTFTSNSGKTISPSFRVNVGWTNFKRLVNSPALQGPLLRVFVWTLAFALLAVLTTFTFGLFLSIIFNDPLIPDRVRKAIRSILLIPYAIPFFLSILTWRGMLNPHVGIVNRILGNLLGLSLPWLSDPWWAKGAVLLVNLWLGFPYMMLITTGALQSIPEEIYDAAEVDGANAWNRFWRITLPLLLVSIGPLLVFSFAFNFNNFNVIYLLNNGGPPIPGTPTPVGHTDILISYSFRLAFEGGRGGDYGYAAAISMIIFLVLAGITLYQFRFARYWEEVSENV